MNKDGPVIIIEDDDDDQEFFREVFSTLNYPNKVHFFSDGQEAIDYLTSTSEPPFLILSDINMPKLNGFELRQKLHTDAALQHKCIPFLFFSTAVNQQMAVEAYSQSVQGFFIKPTSMGELEDIIKTMMEYWKKCAAPNSFG